MKKLNIKALLANHVEKMAFAFFALIVLLVLAKTTWERYAKAPDDLLREIEKVKTAIESVQNVWADEKSYKVVDYNDKARQIFSPISVSYYEFSTQLFFPLYRKDEPRREPNYEPVQELIAKASLVSLSMQLEVEPEKKPEDAKATMDDDATEADNGEFGDRKSATAKPAGAATAATAMSPAGGLGGISLGGGRKSKKDRRREEESDFMGPSGTSGAGPTKKSAAVTSRGVRVIAVRGVFPLQQQIDDFKKALHVSASEAANLVEITDFVLERQVAVQGDDPWKNSVWETVNIESALDMLQEISDFDPEDPVPFPMKDAVITMNLPLRLIGFWHESATHPRLKNDELKSEDMEKENNLLETLDATAEEANVVEAPKPRRRGLASVQPDMKALAKQVRGNSTANEKMKVRFGQMGGAGARGGEDVDRLIAHTKYLLFRYFDFDVQSGYAYRYRARLKLRNPNFETTPEQIAGADPEIAKGEERETTWSNVSNAEVVDHTTNYFLRDVERDPYREEKVRSNSSKPVARLAMYDWDTKLGTVIYDMLNMMVLGGFIGDSKDFKDVKRETEIFDPVQGTKTKKKDHRFSSLDVLLDVETDAEVVPDQHPDLKMPFQKSRHIGLLEEALVATSLGELKTLDPVSEQSDEKYWDNRMKNERKSAKEVAATDEKKAPSATRKRMRGRGRRGGGGGGRGR